MRISGNKTSVIVIIVNWNSGEMLTECLRRLTLQTVLPEKVFVVDNNSIDGSEEIEANFLSCLKILKLNRNIGFAAANNRALDECCATDLVALLNPDAFPELDWIEQMVHAARKFPDVAAFGSRQLCNTDSEILDGVGDIYHFSGLVWRGGYGMRHYPQKKSFEIFSPCAAAAVYRRQALADVDGFDEDYFCYVEDVDLGFRLHLAGHKAMYVPEAVVYHVGSAVTGGHRSDFSVYHGHRNLVWTYIKNMPGLLFWFLLLPHMIMNLATIVYFGIRGQFQVILKAKYDAIKGLPRILHKRKRIQKERISSVRDIWMLLDKQFLPDKKWK